MDDNEELSMSNWYGMYESHDPNEKDSYCAIGIMCLGEANTDEDHDIMHCCDLEDNHEGKHECHCGVKWS